MANLFELATDEQIQKGPDAVYCFGVNPEHMKRYSDNPTVFYDDEANGLLTAAVPNGPQFGYFGYLKKMVLTLHNIVMMKRGRMPYHGAMVRISLKNGKSANIVLIGDTAAGKSETLEAFRLLGGEQIRELKIVADDMGSFDIGPDGRLLGYGTEIGAFIRLDDLQAGYAFEQLDRSIIMSPQKVNARVVLPVTTLEQVLHGYPVDMLLYANNYEQVDSDHPIIEFFKTPESAMKVFREGASMAKGTTTSTGLGHNYYANIFGPPQYRQIHDKLADKIFTKAFESGVRVGQMRSRLGIPGFEASGPKAVAEELFRLISGS
jgi:energy-coupling factor transporter ATP-binding protein EcfA2